MAKPEEYLGIQLWGSRLGSYAYFIEAEQRAAALDNAPIDALYKFQGKWKCVSDLAPSHPLHGTYDAFKKGEYTGSIVTVRHGEKSYGSR